MQAIRIQSFGDPEVMQLQEVPDFIPGPGHIYLGERDLQDIVVPALASPFVQEALAANGWTPPDVDTANAVALQEAQTTIVELEDKVATLEKVIGWQPVAKTNP